MLRFTMSLLIPLTISATVLAEGQTGSSIDWSAWRSLPVLSGGRHKPLDTLAWETTRTLCNRVHFTDPESHRRLDATGLYLVMLFDWQRSKQPTDPHSFAMPDAERYYASHELDRWDQAPLLRVDFLALREALGIPADQQYVAPAWLKDAQIALPNSDQKAPFLAWAKRLKLTQREGFTLLQKKAMELADKYSLFLSHRIGKRLYVVPKPDDQDGAWLSVADLTESDFNDKTDPTGGLRRVQTALADVQTAYNRNKPDQFAQASQAFFAAVAEVGPKLGTYPRRATIDLELGYNRWAPFRFGWVLSAAAFVSLLLYSGTRWKTFYGLGIACYVGSLLAILAGFAIRLAISGRAPVTNMYESVTYVGLGVAVFGLLFEWIYRKRVVIATAAALTTLALILADNCPAVLDPSIQPLQPVLRSNFWLVSHVMCITLSYATFALALGIGNVTLAHYLTRSPKWQAIAELSEFTYKSLQVGVLLLAVGTVLGAVWADYSWGRFWGWDPKEVWALIALLGYLAVLHARFTGWVREFGLAALSVICFALVVMAWYGVNFVLGAGLHSYGFGGGGQHYVYAALGAQFLFVAVAIIRRGLLADAESSPSAVEPTT